MCYIDNPFEPYKVAPDFPYPPIKRPQTGWICPKCGRVNAPWIPSCNCTDGERRDTCFAVMD